MDDATTLLSRKPKRASRKRLIALLITLGVLAIICRPLRTVYASDRLKQSLLNSDLAGVQFALNNGADPDIQISSISPAGFSRNMAEFTRRFLNRSATSRTGNAKTALMFAASNSRPEDVAALLRHDAKVNRRLDNGYSALLYAAPKASSEIVGMLLAKNADVHVQLHDGTTPLLMAAMRGQTQSVRMLLAKGEDIHETDHQSQTALALATENQREETVRLLLSQGADESDLKAAHLSSLNIVTRQIGRPALGMSTMNKTGGASAAPAAPKPSSVPSAPMTPLAFAAKYGSASLLEFLWKRTTPGIKQQVGERMLCRTIESGKIEAVQFLLDQQLPVNPPHCAPPETHSPINVDAAGAGYTPLHYAVSLGVPETFQMVALLVAHGADVNAEDRVGATPLLLAAKGGQWEALSLLITHGANVRAVERGTGQNALMLSIGNGTSEPNVAVARLLLDHGLDVNARDRQGRTALMYRCSVPVATLLLEHGADVNAHDKKGQTPLSIAQGQASMITLLTKAGAKR